MARDEIVLVSILVVAAAVWHAVAWAACAMEAHRAVASAVMGCVFFVVNFFGLLFPQLHGAYLLGYAMVAVVMGTSHSLSVARSRSLGAATERRVTACQMAPNRLRNCLNFLSLETTA